MKFDRPRDAIEYTQDPEAFTFTPSIMGDKRAGSKMASYAETKRATFRGEEPKLEHVEA